jgi:hypothetical protein
MSPEKLSQTLTEVTDLQRKYEDATKNGRQIEAQELLREINKRIVDSVGKDYLAGIPDLFVNSCEIDCVS